MGDTPSPGDAAGSYYTLLRQAPRTHQAFIALACMQCVCIVLERVWLFVLTPMSAEAQQREAVWFLTVILISVCFVLYFAVHGVLQTNAFEMIAFLLASLFLLLRLALEFATNSEECGVASNRDLCLAFIVLASAFVVTAMAFSVKLYRDLQWKRYKALGAAVDTRRMYRYFEAFSALRKLDVQFSLVTLVTGVAFFVGTSKDLGPFATPLSWACLVLFAVELLWERLGDYGVKRESARALAGFWALSGLLPAFIVVVAVESASSNRLLALAVDNSVRWIIAIMAAIALANRIATVAATVVLYRNFGPPYVALRRIIEGDRKEAFSRSRFNRLGRRDAAAPGEGVAGGAGGTAMLAAVTAATAGGVTRRCFVGTIQDMRGDAIVCETELFPRSALEFYTAHNLDELASDDPRYTTLYSSARGGGQGDYRAGMKEKLANVVDCLTRFPASKRAVLTIPNRNVSHEVDEDAKCLRELHFWVDNGALHASGFMRAQAASIFPKNIHFIGTIHHRIAGALGLAVGSYTHVVTTLVSGRD